MDDEQKHLRRLIDNLPPEGNVRCMTVTEKQFAGIKLLVGPPRFVEKRDSASQLLLF
jgi:CRISPR-associated protein Cas2